MEICEVSDKIEIKHKITPDDSDRVTADKQEFCHTTCNYYFVNTILILGLDGVLDNSSLN